MTLDRQSMEQTEVVLGVFVKNHGLNAAALKLLCYSLKILQAIGIEASYLQKGDIRRCAFHAGLRRINGKD